MRFMKQPVTIRLLGWSIETGDSIERIATGFDLPDSLVRSVLVGDSVTISEANGALLCAQMRLDPEVVWPGLTRDGSLDWAPADGHYEPWPVPRELETA